MLVERGIQADTEPSTPVHRGGRRRPLVTFVLLVAATGPALLTVCRVTGLDWFTPLAQLVSFTPYLVPGALAVALSAAALRRWRSAAVASVVVVTLALLLAPRLIGGDAPAPDRAVPLRVMTVNLWHGNATADVMALVRTERPDVLSLQEVTEQALADLEAAGLTDLLPYHAKRPQPGVAGTALYGRAPLAGLRTLDSRTRFDMARAGYVHHGVRLDVVAVHPSPPIPGTATRAWHQEITWLPHATPDDDTVTVLAGDFNATLDHAGLRRLLVTGYVDAADAVGAGLDWTWQAGWIPPVTIDHVLVERHAGVRAVRVHPVGVSDHRAVVADLLLPPPP